MIVYPLFILPINESEQSEAVWYNIEIQLNGTNKNEYTIILPAPIDENSNVINYVNTPRIQKGDVILEQIATPYGKGLKIIGNQSSRLTIGGYERQKNIQYNDDWNYDLSMFNEKPSRNFKNFEYYNPKYNGTVWVFCNQSIGNETIFLEIDFSYSKLYQKPSPMIELVPRNFWFDEYTGFDYWMSSDLYKDIKTELKPGWNLYIISSIPITVE